MALWGDILYRIQTFNSEGFLICYPSENSSEGINKPAKVVKCIAWWNIFLKWALQDSYIFVKIFSSVNHIFVR